MHGLTDLLLAYGKVVDFLFTSLAGWLLLGLALAVFFLFRVWQSARIRALACQAAGQRLGVGERLALVLKELYGLSLGFLASVPAIVAVVALATGLYALSGSINKLNQMRENAERISQLSIVLRNLEQRHRVADVLVSSVRDGLTSLELTYYLAGQDQPVAERQLLRVPGRTIYFDAIVCNFAYAEIASGRHVNLAIPCRVFSDQLPQASGLALNLRDEAGLPYMYKRSDQAVYGLAPELYHQRLAELMAILDDEASARLNGVVRSVYGSAVHRRVSAGDRFTIWVEQSGGLVIKEAADF